MTAHQENYFFVLIFVVVRFHSSCLSLLHATEQTGLSSCAKKRAVKKCRFHLDKGHRFSYRIQTVSAQSVGYFQHKIVSPMRSADNQLILKLESCLPIKIKSQLTGVVLFPKLSICSKLSADCIYYDFYLVT